MLHRWWRDSDRVRFPSRRMMMTSGSKVHYKSMFDAGSQIIAKEGAMSLFKGAGYVRV